MITSVMIINAHQTRLTPWLTRHSQNTASWWFPAKISPHRLRQPNNFRRWQLSSTIIVRGGRWVGGTLVWATILIHQFTRHVFPLWYWCHFWIQSHLCVQKIEEKNRELNTMLTVHFYHLRECMWVRRVQNIWEFCFVCCSFRGWDHFQNWHGKDAMAIIFGG